MVAAVPAAVVDSPAAEGTHLAVVERSAADLAAAHSEVARSVVDSAEARVGHSEVAT